MSALSNSLPVIALGGEERPVGRPQACAVLRPAQGAVWLYWVEDGQLVDEVTLDIATAADTISALSGALETAEFAFSLCGQLTAAEVAHG